MNQGKDYIEEERISLGLFLQWLNAWIKYLLSKWLPIGIGAFIILFLVIGYNYIKPKLYFSKISFVLETESTNALGGISSIASVAGINLNSLTDGNTLFQIDNIQELYRSESMIEKTLLAEYSFKEGNQQIVNKLAKVLKIDDKLDSEGLDLEAFRSDRSRFSRAQDSVLMEFTELIQEQFLHVAKPNRKTSILEVGFYNKDEELAKALNEIHVNNVNQFYSKTKSKKAALSVDILSHQADSVKTALDASILLLAEVNESIPNPNPLYKTSQVPYQKAMIQVQASSAVYQEIVKQLELAKITLRNDTPLIQVIDSPRFPLEHNRWSFFKTIVIGGGIGLALMFVYFTLKRMLMVALEN